MVVKGLTENNEETGLKLTRVQNDANKMAAIVLKVGSRSVLTQARLCLGLKIQKKNVVVRSAVVIFGNGERKVSWRQKEFV